MNKVHRGVVAVGVSAVVGAALVAPGVQAAPGVGVSSTGLAVYWDGAQRAGGTGLNPWSSASDPVPCRFSSQGRGGTCVGSRA